MLGGWDSSVSQLYFGLGLPPKITLHWLNCTPPRYIKAKKKERKKKRYIKRKKDKLPLKDD